MEIITDEKKIKTPSLFLKLKNGSKVRIFSHLIRILTCYIPALKKSILWSEQIKEQKKRQEFFYWASVDEEEGILRVPGSIFFSMNENEKLIGKDKRNFEWLISKSGEGLNTRYEAIRGVEISSIEEALIKKNTERLKKVLVNYEKKLAEGLREYLGPKKSKGQEENIEEVDPEEIPL